MDSSPWPRGHGLASASCVRHRGPVLSSGRRLFTRFGSAPPSSGQALATMCQSNQRSDGKAATVTTTTDPVCGKQLETGQAVATIEHDLYTHFFCSEDCRNDFESAPDRYVTHSPQPTCAACGESIAQEDLVCPHCHTPLAAG